MKSNFSLLPLALLISFIFNMSQAIPQNVSELIITTESKLDICCTTLNSQIDQLTNIVETTIAATFTTIGAIASDLLEFAESFTGLATLGLCDAIPLTVSSLGKTISTSGVYCLTSDVDLGTNSILISVNNVVLNLNGYTISGSSTNGMIEIAATSFVTIENGYIIGTTTDAFGISYPSGSITHLVLQDLVFNNGNNAISLSSVSNSLFQNIHMINFNNNGTGISLTGSLNDIIFNNCVVDSSPSLQGQGIILNCTSGDNATGITFNNCICNNCANDSFALTLCAATFDNCQVNYGQSNAFVQFLNGATVTGSLYKNCISRGSNNNGNFVVITGSSDTGSSFTFENCIVAGGGFGFQAQAHNCFFKNCSATDTTSDGFNVLAANGIIQYCTASNCSHGFNLLSNSADYTVANCLATQNSVGFNNAGTNNIFYGNTATSNSTSYQGITSPPSAPQVLFASATYGANLADILP